ncbi:sensor histidine kinase [Flavivirga sp. 57AJ16]|uniref:sensor histidine kinase n=1 Tax=Flavivirga sp. 57AJ16 TaxID=3025307 RepID=UPI0023670A8B|nr:histidine kinase [Flavivirga sp. 57AJ16]MDD7886934.1 histidine kinase [Flavivirga sp. 57AJ16]
MNKNRLILLISISFSFLVNVPRIIFLFGGEGKEIIDLLEVSVEDTILRFLLLFIFCYVVLKFNLQWLQKFNVKYQFLASIAINLIIISVWMLLFKLINDLVININLYTINPQFNAFVYSFVLLMLLVIVRAIKLINQSKLDAIEKEQLKQQSLQSELAALKNQVNPHFLFNSLNSLSLLVREDQKEAGKFINKLSFLYRYILQSKDQDLVTIKEELRFLDSYIHLIKQRYRDNFNVNIHIDEKLLQKKIPTLALQLLMENAVKHNEISDNKPLLVDVFDENDRLVVKNKLQKRTGHIESTNTGLSNLNTRFKLNMNGGIEISKDDVHFTVKIPMI